MEENPDSYFTRVLKRTREVARINAGKASATPGNPDTGKLKVGANPPIGTATGGKSAAQTLPNSDDLAQGRNAAMSNL